MATVQDINAEIGRIAAAKANIIGAIEQKGVSVPAGSLIQDLPPLIESIPYPPIDNVVFSLENYEMNGTVETAINTGLRLFNLDDFPNGFKIIAKVKLDITVSYGTTRFVLYCRHISPQRLGFYLMEQNPNSFNLLYDSKGTSTSGVSGTSISFIYSADDLGRTDFIIETTPLYDVMINYFYENILNRLCLSTLTHVSDDPLIIGGAINDNGTWQNGRFGYGIIESLKVIRK